MKTKIASDLTLLRRGARLCRFLVILPLISLAHAGVIGEENGDPARIPYFADQVFQEIARTDGSFDANGILYSSNFTPSTKIISNAVAQLDGSSVSSDAVAVPNGFFSGRNSATMRVTNGSPNLRYSTSAGQGSRTQIVFTSPQDVVARSVFHWHVSGTQSAPFGQATGRLDFVAGQLSDKDFFYIFQPGNGALSVLGPGDYQYTLANPPLNTPIDLFFWSSAFAFVDFGQAPAGSNFTSTADYGSTYELVQVDLFDPEDNLIPEWTMTDVESDKVVFTQDGPVPQCNPAPENLVAWYPGEGNADDIQGANNGMLQNGATFAGGKVGQAFSFDGVDDQVVVPHNANQNPGAQITIDAWVYPTSSGHGRSILQKRSPSNVGGYVLETTHSPFGPDNGLAWVIWIGGTPHSLLTPANVLTIGTFQHVAATYDGATMRIFVDGVEKANMAVTGAIDAVTDDIVIGRNVVVPANDWQGLIDEVDLFDRALLQPEIESIVHASSAGKCEPATSSLELTAAVSRKTHGAGGDFDLPLVLDPAGSGTVEPRSGGPTQVILTFSENVVAADGMISANEFAIANASFGSASISGKEITLNLSGVVDQSVVTIALSGLTTASGSPLSGDNNLEIRALLADANQDRSVSRPDLMLLRSHKGQSVDDTNFVLDLDLDGVIGKGDSRLVGQNKSHSVP